MALATESIEAAPRKRRLFATVRPGGPKGPRIDPAESAHWVIDRATGQPYIGRPMPLRKAWAEVRDLLRTRDPWDPWVARLCVVATRGELRGKRKSLTEAPQRELPCPELVQWELRGRRERLGLSSAHVARRSGLHPRSLWYAEHGKGIRPDTLARVRAFLSDVERRRGLIAGATWGARDD